MDIEELLQYQRRDSQAPSAHPSLSSSMVFMRPPSRTSRQTSSSSSSPQPHQLWTVNWLSTVTPGCLPSATSMVIRFIRHLRISFQLLMLRIRFRRRKIYMIVNAFYRYFPRRNLMLYRMVRAWTRKEAMQFNAPGSAGSVGTVSTVTTTTSSVGPTVSSSSGTESARVPTSGRSSPVPIEFDRRKTVTTLDALDASPRLISPRAAGPERHNSATSFRSPRSISQPPPISTETISAGGPGPKYWWQRRNTFIDGPGPNGGDAPVTDSAAPSSPQNRDERLAKGLPATSARSGRRRSSLLMTFKFGQHPRMSVADVARRVMAQCKREQRRLAMKLLAAADDQEDDDDDVENEEETTIVNIDEERMVPIRFRMPIYAPAGSAWIWEVFSGRRFPEKVKYAITMALFRDRVSEYLREHRAWRKDHYNLDGTAKMEIGKRLYAQPQFRLTKADGSLYVVDRNSKNRWMEFLQAPRDSPEIREAIKIMGDIRLQLGHPLEKTKRASLSYAERRRSSATYQARLAECLSSGMPSSAGSSRSTSVAEVLGMSSGRLSHQPAPAVIATAVASSPRLTSTSDRVSSPGSPLSAPPTSPPVIPHISLTAGTPAKAPVPATSSSVSIAVGSAVAAARGSDSSSARLFPQSISAPDVPISTGGAINATSSSGSFTQTASAAPVSVSSQRAPLAPTNRNIRRRNRSLSDINADNSFSSTPLRPNLPPTFVTKPSPSSESITSSIAQDSNKPTTPRSGPSQLGDARTMFSRPRSGSYGPAIKVPALPVSWTVTRHKRMAPKPLVLSGLAQTQERMVGVSPNTTRAQSAEPALVLGLQPRRSSIPARINISNDPDADSLMPKSKTSEGAPEFVISGPSFAFSAATGKPSGPSSESEGCHQVPQQPAQGYSAVSGPLLIPNLAILARNPGMNNKTIPALPARNSEPSRRRRIAR